MNTMSYYLLFLAYVDQLLRIFKPGMHASQAGMRLVS